ncbi:MAG: methylated-DNA--[protein]-cysteine S-methyltransferase [Byssovorax sp.]
MTSASIHPREASGHLLLPTSFGVCVLAFSSKGLVFFQLPERTEKMTLARVLRHVSSAEGAPPGWMKDALARLDRYFAGEDEDLLSIPVDLDGVPPFHRKVYEAMRRIRRGHVWTYAELAREAGSPQAFRAVGQAMAKNPIPVVIPCHRVVAAGGKPGGFSAPGGLVTKERLLRLEGASLSPQAPLFAR